MPYKRSKTKDKNKISKSRLSKKGGSYAGNLKNSLARRLLRKSKKTQNKNEVFKQFKQRRDKGCTKYMEFTEYDTETGAPIIWRHPQLFNSETGRPCSSKDRVFADAYDEDYNLGLKLSLTLTTLAILLYFIFPSKLVEIVSRINII